jgi:hypothetical protein
MTVTHLRSRLAKARGVIGRDVEVGDEFHFHYPHVGRRGIHMVGVRRPLRVQWFVSGDLEQSAVLRPWIGYGAADADLVVETVLPEDHHR